MFVAQVLDMAGSLLRVVARTRVVLQRRADSRALTDPATDPVTDPAAPSSERAPTGRLARGTTPPPRHPTEPTNIEQTGRFARESAYVDMQIAHADPEAFVCKAEGTGRAPR